MRDQPTNQNRRIRMLYSLKDIQLAISAADFLQACDPDEAIQKVELRRYKCYETTAIVAYARPFSESRGGIPKLSMKMIGVRLDQQHWKIGNRPLSALSHGDERRNCGFAELNAKREITARSFHTASARSGQGG